jgi:hypothetical protein
VALPDNAFTANFLPANTRLAVLGTVSNQIATLSHVWKYSDNNAALPANWFATAYDDSGADWQSGAGPFDTKKAANGAAGVNCRDTSLYSLGPVGTCIKIFAADGTTQLPTVYFRTHFTAPFAGGSNALLHLQGKVDDGAVIYLNGVEIGRVGMAAGAVTQATLANRTVGDGDAQDALEFYAPNLVAGDNVLAIEAHQVNLTSSDITMGFDMSLVTGGLKVGPRITIIRDQFDPGAFDIVWTGNDRLETSDRVDTGWFSIDPQEYQGHGPNGSNSFHVFAGDADKAFFRTVSP